MPIDIFGPQKRKRTLTSADKKRIAANQNWKCKMCGGPLPVRYHIDHIKEFSGGGSDRESNLQALCPNCHADKTEEDRHRRKQEKLKNKEKQDIFGFGGSSIFGPTPKRKKTDDIFGGNIFGQPSKKGGGKNLKVHLI